MYMYEEKRKYDEATVPVLRIDMAAFGRPTIRLFQTPGDKDGVVMVGNSTIVAADAIGVVKKTIERDMYPRFMWNCLTEEDPETHVGPAFNWYLADVKKYVDAIIEAEMQEELLADFDVQFDNTVFACRENTGYYDDNEVWHEGVPVIVKVKPTATTGEHAYETFDNTWQGGAVTVHDHSGTAYSLAVTVSLDENFFSTVYEEQKVAIPANPTAIYAAQYHYDSENNEWTYGSTATSMMSYFDVALSTGTSTNLSGAWTTTDGDKKQEYLEKVAEKEATLYKDPSEYSGGPYKLYTSATVSSANQYKPASYGAVDGNVYTRVTFDNGDGSYRVADYYFVPYGIVMGSDNSDEIISSYKQQGKEVIGFYLLSQGVGGALSARLFASNQFVTYITDATVRQHEGIISYIISIEHATDTSAAQSYKITATATDSSANSYDFVISNWPATQEKDVWVADQQESLDKMNEDFHIKGKEII